MRIYLDYAAGAPLTPETKRVMRDFGADFSVGNPSSVHAEGRRSQGLLDGAVATIAAIFGVAPTEVVLTSGATESNNSAISGVLRRWRLDHHQKPHVVLPAVEHSSWRQALGNENAVVTVVPVNESGVVSVEAVMSSLGPNTALVGCSYVQNEIGVIQPVAEIGSRLRRIANRKEGQYPVFHVDAAQAFPYVNTHIDHLKADLVTFSGHKSGALAGAGLLLVKSDVAWEPMLRGGGQQWGKRAGTENLLGALTLAAALEYSDAHRAALTAHAAGLQRRLEEAIARRLPQVKILGQNVPRAPHISGLWLPGVADESVVHRLDLAGLAISSGSACSSGAQRSSSTLVAMGFSPREAYGGLRVSFGRFTTRAEIDVFVAALTKIVVSLNLSGR